MAFNTQGTNTNTRARLTNTRKRVNVKARGAIFLFAEVLDLPGWRKTDPLACLMLAGFASIVLQPIVYGELGSTIMALMTPVK